MSLKFIDLFAGIGGFHLALSNLGMKCVFASEFDEAARKTYLANHEIEEQFFNTDIRSASYDLIPDHDILCAGFPCQAFSHAGKRVGLTDGSNSERGNLFYCISEILEVKKPRAFILENVRGLVNHDNGNTFKVIKEELEAQGYVIYHKVLKASEFGRPQHRPRIFIVGFNKDKVDTTQPFEFPQPIPLEITMSDVWEGECARDIGLTLRVGGKSSPIDDRRNWDGYIVNGEIKRISPKEGKRMMGFPDDFIFPGTKSQAMKQLGNGVCVDVVQHVASSVESFLKKNTKTVNMREKKMTLNKGEWSEFFAFLKMLSSPQIYFGDENLEISSFQDYVTIYELQHIGSTKVYVLDEGQLKIIDGSQSTNLGNVKDIISTYLVDEIQDAIISARSRTFNINQNELLKLLDVIAFKGDSQTKADILVSHEYKGLSTSSDPWGIKSFLGSCPTLLNAGSTTNFVYEITNFNGDMNTINNISTRSKIKDRIKAIYNSSARLKFSHCENEIFHENLRKTDSLMPEYLSDILIKYYSGLGSNLTDLVDNDVIRIRVTDFLKAVLLGMFSSKPWDGKYNCNGLLVIRPQGDLLLYHVIKDNDLKDYLFKNTRLDTASSTRHRFGSIYQERNGKYYFKLNLQIRNK
ncbi:HpaII family restriction endonuclease [Acinetobacter guillouiae]|uniref:HpaII family restriction endonuclease n=3 Tax=Acinetobacter TaxID=469 RepID=UPI003AF9EA3A